MSSPETRSLFRESGKGKEVMNKASEEARFLGGGPERSRIRLRRRACCHPTASLKKCISRGDYPFSKRRRAGLPLFCRPTTVAALEERRGERKAKQKTLFRQREKSSLHIKHEARQIQAPQIPSPSLAGQTETLIRQVSWLQSSSLRHLPMLSHSGTAGSLAVTVAGPRRTPTGFPIKSYNT